MRVKTRFSCETPVSRNLVCSTLFYVEDVVKTVLSPIINRKSLAMYVSSVDSTRGPPDGPSRVHLKKKGTRQAVAVRRALEDMGHKQLASPIQTDNTTALGFVTKSLNPKATKSTDMKYWWLRDKSDQEQFHYYWNNGKGNCADYLTKHFCAAHHRQTRPSILTSSAELNKFRISKVLHIR